MGKTSMVPLLDVDGETGLGLVPYTSNLDYWDGHNQSNGKTGRHSGIGKLKAGGFYLCHGTQWEGERDYAETIDEATAKSLAIAAGWDSDEYREMFGEDIPML
jgi:hypothetical protein